MPESAGFSAFTDVTQARMSSTRALFTYWQRLWRGEMLPRRIDIDPAEIKAILPLILLGNIEAEPFRVLFRLVGTAVAEFSRQDFSGRYLDQLSYDSRDSIEWEQCYRYIHAHHHGIIGVNQLNLAKGDHTNYEFAILPLSRDNDSAGSFIAIEAYDDFDPLRIPDMTPVTERR